MCTTSSTLERYKAELKKCADAHSSERITNKNEEYAAAFYAELFRNTDSTVKIFCEGAHSCIWRNPEFQEGFENLLKTPSITVLILTEENVENVELFPEYLQTIIKRKPENLQFRHLNQEAREIISSRFEEDVNFAVFDNDKFRFEFDKTHYTAYGSFNDPEIVEEIQRYFDTAFEKADVTDFKFSDSPTLDQYIMVKEPNNATTYYSMEKESVH